jgi:hypothetical protein
MERQIFGILLAAVVAANVGCNDKPAPPVAPPQSPTTPTPVTPSPPPVPANSIEDPPVIGTPQEAFNFPRQPL